jgi:hypothetical protein
MLSDSIGYGSEASIRIRIRILKKGSDLANNTGCNYERIVIVSDLFSHI